MTAVKLDLCPGPDGFHKARKSFNSRPSRLLLPSQLRVHIIQETQDIFRKPGLKSMHMHCVISWHTRDRTGIL